MVKTVYYIIHKDTAQRLKWYKTIAGARIAQRQRNNTLGFHTRICRTQEGHLEFELCETLEHSRILATWAIQEDTIESTVDALYDNNAPASSGGN